MVSAPIALRDVAFWLAALCCVVANVAILHSVLKTVRVRGASAAPAAPGERVQTEHAMPATRPAIEIFWAVVPMLAVAAVLVATWRAMHPTP